MNTESITNLMSVFTELHIFRLWANCSTGYTFLLASNIQKISQEVVWGTYFLLEQLFHWNVLLEHPSFVWVAACLWHRLPVWILPRWVVQSMSLLQQSSLVLKSHQMFIAPFIKQNTFILYSQSIQRYPYHYKNMLLLTIFNNTKKIYL